MLGGGVQEVPSLGVTGPRLDRQKWHCQKISVIITHFNYSTFIGDALLSLLDQTHENWECVIVDDCSAPEERERLKQVVDAIGSPKIKVLWLPENVGQLSAFFAGFDETDGHFVCLLDPDDRYAETFLEEAVSAHLNKTIVCPIVCTDQYSLV